jgi:diguanylate cyclase (GGDEF)-like protein
VVSVICFVTVAIMLYRLPVRRKTLGSRLSMTVFLLMATLWVVYAFGFSPSLRAAGGLHNVAIGFVARMNGFFDLGTHIVLAFGMVLILLEEAKREVDAAHARLGVAHRRLRDQSLRDPLTGALNRRAFENNVGLEQVANGGAVLVLDLDNLKQTNDTYGHVAGDRLLESLANLLDEGLRDSDSLYRWGGDEFLLIMPGAHAATVRPRIQEQVDRFGQCRIPDGTTLQLEVSIGGTDFVDESALESAIGRADEAMYEHKRERKRSVEAAGENG